VLAATAGAKAVWFGTIPYMSGLTPRGGIARYDLATGTWQVYTVAHGLPPDKVFPDLPAPIYALAMGEESSPWVGTAGGVSFPTDAYWWRYTATHGLRPGAVRALVIGEVMVAATPSGLDRLDPDAVSGVPPTVQIGTISPLTLISGTVLSLSGGGVDNDEAGARIVAWDWSSSLDGPLCTTTTCELPYNLFTTGEHTITLRAQDDEGIWSAPAKARIKVGCRVYLPLVVRND
jgi:hypothetical protein